MLHDVYIVLGLIALIAIFAFALSRSIKKFDFKMTNVKKKKGRNKYV